MTQVEENGPEHGGDDILAAEYVLGVLPEDERLIVVARIEREPEFARIVDGWEAHFAPLASTYPAIEPPATVKTAIERRLFNDIHEPSPAEQDGSEEADADRRTGLWASLAFWRGLTATAIAALAIYIALPYVLAPPGVSPTRLVASLTAEGSEVRYLAVYDASRREIALSQVSGRPPTGKDFELWMIEGANPPVSMGVIPAGATAHLAVGDGARAGLSAGAVLAVSVEPAGGSTTGRPTGPVVASGDLKNI